MSILGNRVVRREDRRFLTVGGTYVDDIRPPHTAHAVFVRSTAAHARIVVADTDEARGMPGVVGVFTAEDLAELGLCPHPIASFPEAMLRPFLAAEVVRHVGEAIVAVVADTKAQALDAAELVFIDYEDLPMVTDPEAAALDEDLLFPDFGTNVINRLASETQADFADAEVVVSERIVNQRLTAAPIEPRSGMAWWTDDGRLVHYSACQGAHPTRDLLADVYNLDPSDIRVVVPDVGGGFGAKSRTYADEAALGFFARAVGRPVTWTETRSENLASMPQGRGQIQHARLGGTRDGHITAYQLNVVQDVGAYPLIGAVLAGLTQRMLTGVYHLDNVGFTSVAVTTNMVPITAYRGAGRPEATVAIERMVDRYAYEIGMDPAEVRRINMVPRFTEPYTTGIGTVYDVGDYPEALRLVLEAADYSALRDEQERSRQNGGMNLMGIGLGTYVEITAGGPGGEYGSVELQPDGRLRIVTGATAYGQGHETTWAMIVAERTGVPMDRIDVVAGDTDEVVRGGLTVGSRSVQLAGSAIVGATGKLIDSMRNLAAQLLEAAAADVVLDSDAGRFHVAGTPAVAVDWLAIAAALDGPALEFMDFTAEMPTFPSGAHLAVVDVDRDTGGVTLRRMIAVDDAGRIINPLLAEGQVHGGLAQGIAQALMEEICYDEYGNLLTSNFMDYAVISAAELPSFEVSQLETPTWVNELGAKGVGESGTIGAIPAVYNAVLDALSPLGVAHLCTPLTPERVWRAIQSS